MARRAIIVGGGIGGMTAALALRRVAFEVTILERRRRLEDLHSGGGMVLWHNAIRALGRLGLADRMSAAGSPLDSMAWTTSRDHRIGSWPLAELNRELGLTAIGIARSRVHAVLTAELESGLLQMGREVLGSEQDGDGVSVLLEDGSHLAGDVLIGADGINSMTRAHQGGVEPVRPAGYDLSFGITEFDPQHSRERAFAEVVGPGARFISFPVGGGLIYWSAIYVPNSGTAEGYGVSRADLLAMYAGWPEPTEALIAATDEKTIYRREINDRKPTRRWGEGRVTLLGDAAHPMTPNLGQGACQAVEDALVLADCLGSGSDLVAALRSYEQRRMARTAGFVNRSWMIGSMGRWKQPLACLVRTQIQRLVFPTVAYQGHRRDMAYKM